MTILFPTVLLQSQGCFASCRLDMFKDSLLRLITYYLILLYYSLEKAHLTLILCIMFVNSYNIVHQSYLDKMNKRNFKMEHKYLLAICMGLAFINIHSHRHFSAFHDKDPALFTVNPAGSLLVGKENDIADQMAKTTEIEHDASRPSEEQIYPSHTISTREEVMRLLKGMQDGKVVNKGDFTFILEESKKLLHSLENVYHISHPAKKEGSLSNSTVTIVGDIHGQYPLMLDIFMSNGYPCVSHVYIFNGDFTDKGKYSLQTFTALLILKLYCPDCIHFTRGNHEARKYFKRKLHKQIMKHYKDKATFKLALEVAHEIPLGIIVDNKTLVIHAGISGPDLSIADMNRIPKSIDTTENELLDEIVWSDPQDQDGILDDPNRGRYFGPDISKAFLELNHLDRIIRGHDNVKDGYMVHHQGRVVTVWSAPTYRGRKGSYVNLNITGALDVHFFESPEVTIMEEEGNGSL